MSRAAVTLVVVLLACSGESRPPAPAAPAAAPGDPLSEPAASAPEPAPTDVCAEGVEHDPRDDEACGMIARGLCFRSKEAACACLGCPLAKCSQTKSIPPYAVCGS